MCRRTVRGPLFGAPLERLLTLPGVPGVKEFFVAFSSGENVRSLHMCVRVWVRMRMRVLVEVLVRVCMCWLLIAH
jgi:hypothetical protein